MIKEYRSSVLSVIKTAVLGIFFLGLVYYGTSIFLENPLWVYGLTAGAGLFYIYFALISSLVYVRLEGEELLIREGRKKMHFRLSEWSITAKTSSGGEAELEFFNGEKRLYADCSLLGQSQFYSLMEDLGIVGDKQKPIELETRRRD